MPQFEILSRWSGKLLFRVETESLKLAVEAGVKNGVVLSGVDLREADLRGAVLVGAVLRGAFLRGADLRDTDLREADLRDVDLRNADLRNAVLRDAVLRDAVLCGADLSGADLRDANLRGAVLSGIDLRGADLRDTDLRDVNLSDTDVRGADLTTIRDDLWAVLSYSPAEASGLRQAILDGKIDGSTYEGECACLVGTLANLRQCDYKDLPNLRPDSGRPAERFFLAIKPGDTPQTSQFSRLALDWVDEWLTNMQRVFASTRLQDRMDAR